jgi:recombination protein RecR
MATIPKVVRELIEAFERLPGIGPKSAQRLTYYLLHAPKEEADSLANAALALKESTVLCSVCFNISEKDPCEIDTDPLRDKTIIAVVEDPLDVLALDRTNFKGLYHVLHGAISPLQNIGPDELHVKELLPRLKDGVVTEVILATNPTMEGEATALYVEKMIREGGYDAQTITVSRIGHGLPMGADIEYADGVTLARALEGRRHL